MACQLLSNKVVIDDRSRTHPISNRFRSTRLALLVLLVVFSSGWLWLYVDSVYHRREAESLIADLRSFPFASASFLDVRELALRHGGAALQQFPPLSFPRYGVPSRDSQGQVHVPFVQTEPMCTPRDCTFEIWIRPSPLKFTLSFRSEMLLLSALVHSGIRPWGVYARFEVVNGKLEGTLTSVGGLRTGKSGRYEGMVPLEYEIVSSARPVYGDKDYSVGSPHVTGGPMDILRVELTQTPGAPTARAFDVNPHCLTAVFQGCSFSQLAPSAWSDYRREANQ